MKATHTRPASTPTDPPVITPADLLRMAALYLARHGWIQGEYYDYHDPNTATPKACAIGAIGMAVHGTARVAPEHTDGSDPRDVARVRDVLYNFLDLDSGIICDDQGQPVTEPTVAEWNDDPARTLTEVITALNGAADMWDRLHTTGGGNR